MNKTLKTIMLASIAGLFAAILLQMRFYSIYKYVDIHSGDIKEVQKVCHIKIQEEITQTEFSKLVRKYLGDQKEPEWKTCYGTDWYLFGARGSKGGWYSAPSMCNKFIGAGDNSISESELMELLRECLSDMEKNDRASFDNRLGAYLKREN